MDQEIKLLDVVALLRAVSSKNLKIGQVGTVVEVFGKDDFEVEFTDKQGKTIAILPLKREDLLVLHYELETV